MRCCWLQSKVEDDAKTWYILLLLFEACFFGSSSPHFIVDVVVVVDKFPAILSHQSPIRGAIERDTEAPFPFDNFRCPRDDDRVVVRANEKVSLHEVVAVVVVVYWFLSTKCCCNCVCWAFYNILFTHLKRRKCVLFPETRRTPTRYVCKNKIVIISIPIYSIRFDSPPIKNQTATTSTAGMLVIATK